MDNRFDLHGRTALVVGGSRGIGRAAALALAASGADVLVASRDEEACKKVAAEIERTGRRGFAGRADAAREADLQALFDRVDQTLGGCDILVNCAGIAQLGPAAETTRADFDRILGIHLYGAADACRFAYPRMKRRGRGAIVNVASVWGLGGQKLAATYGAAKAALINYTKVLAVEWAQDGIRVNAVAPGLIETDMTAAALGDPALKVKLTKAVPQRRAASPEEVGWPIAFLCSAAASFITGAVLVIDGGLRAR